MRERTIKNPTAKNLNDYGEFLLEIKAVKKESEVCQKMKEDCPSIPLWRFTKLLASKFKDGHQRQNALAKFKTQEATPDQVDDYFVAMLQLESF